MIIHQVEGLVIVYWEEDVQAIRPKWETLYREDTALRDALEWCFIYVQQYNVKNWVADLSEFKEGLSEPDKSWATKHFNRRIVEIGIERFVTLITPQQMEKISNWDASAREKFKSKLSLFHASSLEEAKNLLQ
jgi:hypothetical protein